MANPYASDPFEILNLVGITDYGLRLDNNFARVVTADSAQDVRIKALEVGSLPASADAATNIPNLCVNGEFLRSYYSPEEEDDLYVATMPIANATDSTLIVRWTDGWFVGEMPSFSPNSLDVVTVDTAKAGMSGLEHGIRVKRGAAGSDWTGVIYQRLDLYYDLQAMVGKSLQFAVQFTTTVDGQFHLEVDDGITVSTSLPTAPTAQAKGTHRVAHVIDLAATKLVVRIVIDVDVPAAAADDPVFHLAHARLGINQASLVGGTPPGNPLDDIASQYTGRIVRWQDPIWGPGIFSSGGVDTSDLTIHHQFILPLVMIKSTDLQTALYLEDSTTANSVTLLAVTPPTFTVLVTERRWGPNAPVPAVDPPRRYIHQGRLNLHRAVPTDPAVADQGFDAKEIYAFLVSIPAP